LSNGEFASFRGANKYVINSGRSRKALREAERSGASRDDIDLAYYALKSNENNRLGAMLGGLGVNQLKIGGVPVAGATGSLFGPSYAYDVAYGHDASYADLHLEMVRENYRTGEATRRDVRLAEEGAETAGYWKSQSLLGLLDLGTTSTSLRPLLKVMARQGDQNAAEYALDDAMKAYREDPSRSNGQALEMAEMTVERREAGVMSAMFGLPGLDNSELGSLMWWKMNKIRSEVSEMGARIKERDFRQTHGYNPREIYNNGGRAGGRGRRARRFP
jgi:hypothetical protein